MTVLEAVRNLGDAIQKDERFIRYAKAKIAYETDQAMLDKIGEFNTIRMNLDNEMTSENADEEKKKELNQKLRDVYSEIMSNPIMVEFNAAKADVDTMINDVNSVIMQCLEGADPATCEPEVHCSGSCSTCGGCH